MQNKKGAAVSTGMLVSVFLVIIVLFVGFAYYMGTRTEAAIEEIEEELEEVVLGECNPEATNPTPEIAIAARNSENSTGREYMTGLTFYIYKGADTSDANFLTSGTTTATGLAAIGNATKVTCEDAGYTVVLFAVDNSTTSDSIFVDNAELNDNRAEHTFVIPQHTTHVMFRVYDRDEKAYVMDAENLTAYGEDGSTFYQTTASVTTGKTIATDGDFSYNIYLKTNITLETDSQFTDEQLYMGINADDTAEWDEPTTFKVDGGTVSLLDDCPTKIGNDGYDWCYEIMQGTAPYVIGKSEAEFQLDMRSNSGVNPSDDVVVAAFTSGWYIHTLDEGSESDFNKDDSSKTYVYDSASITLAFE